MTSLKIISDQRCVSLNDINNKVKIIAEKFNPEKIILFGSYAKETPTPGSDVDLLVIMNPQTSTWEASINISLALKHNFPMDIIVRTPQEVSKRIALGDNFLKDIMKQGKILYERTC